MTLIRRLSSTDPGFEAGLTELLRIEEEDRERVRSVVRDILSAVRERGNAALVEFSNRFDRLHADGAQHLEIPRERLAQAADRIEPLVREAL